MTPNRLPDIVGGLVALLVATAIIASFFDLENRKLDVVASAELIKGTVSEDGSISDDTWRIDGRVLYDGTPISGAVVWAIVSNPQGDKVAPDVATTADGGRFIITDIPLRLGSSRRNETSDATVFAKVKRKSGKELIEERGEQSVKLSSVGQIRWIELPYSTLLSLTLIFVTSIVIAVVQLPPGTFRLKLKYFGSVFLAFLFTFRLHLAWSAECQRIGIAGRSPDIGVRQHLLRQLRHGHSAGMVTFVDDAGPGLRRCNRRVRNAHSRFWSTAVDAAAGDHWCRRLHYFYYRSRHQDAAGLRQH